MHLLKESIKTIIISFIVSSGVFFAFAQTWNPPSAEPPSENVRSPLTLNEEGNFMLPDGVKAGVSLQYYSSPRATLDVGGTVWSGGINLRGESYDENFSQCESNADIGKIYVGSGCTGYCTQQLRPADKIVLYVCTKPEGNPLQWWRIDGY